MRYKVGQVMRFTFWDHTENEDGAWKITVYGKIAEVKPKYLKVYAWVPEGEDERSDPKNITRFAIVRSTIIEAKELVEKD